MPNIPCNNELRDCDCIGDTPFKNLSAEEPDVPTFGAVFYGRQIAPLGTQWQRITCAGVCESEVSQLAADLCAVEQSLQCIGGTWGSDGGGGGSPPVPPPAPPRGRLPWRLYGNEEQTGEAICPDGNTFTFTVPADAFFAVGPVVDLRNPATIVLAQAAQAQANAQALSAAQTLAQQHLLCLSDIQERVCVGEPYSSTIVATGSFVGATNFWSQAPGELPPGLSMPDGFLPGNSVTISGTPTTPGTYTFTVTIILANGDFTKKEYTINVPGIANADALPDGTVGSAYSVTLEAIGITNPIYSLEGGALPDGLTLDSTGVIFGTPTVAGDFNFTLGVTEAGTGQTCNVDCTITVAPNLCTLNGNFIGTITPNAGISPTWCVYAPSANLVFGGGGTTFIDVMSPVTNTKVGTINLVNNNVFRGAYHPNTDRVYVAGDNSPPDGTTRVSIINPNTLTVVGSVIIPQGNLASQIAVDTVNDRIYVQLNFGGVANLVAVDVNTLAVTVIDGPAVGGSGVTYATSNNRIFAWSGGAVLNVFDAATFGLIGVVTTNVVSVITYNPIDNCVYYDDQSVNGIIVLKMNETLNRTVAVPFVVPAVGGSVAVQFNSTSGFTVGNTITIGGKDYTIDQINAPPTVTLINVNDTPLNVVPAATPAVTLGMDNSTTVVLPNSSIGIQYSSRHQKCITTYADGTFTNGFYATIDPVTHLLDPGFMVPNKLLLILPEVGQAENCELFFATFGTVGPPDLYTIVK